jgi:esterase
MKLFCRKSGEGPPLIILHGLFGSSDNWIPVAKSISSFFTVYLPDLRNHGNSPHDEIHDYISMSRDLHEFASENGLDKFFLAGHSMGGKVAMTFSSLWPGMLEGLVIADISPFPDVKRKNEAKEENSLILKTITDTDLASARSRPEVEAAISGNISSERTRGLIMKNLRRRDDKSFEWKINAGALYRNLGKIIDDIPVRRDYPGSQITGFPVIFLKGEHSEHLKEEDFAEILKLYPAADIRTVRGAGHWIQSDNPEAVTDALISLLD